MSPPLASQNVEQRLLRLQRCIIIRALCILKTEKEILELEKSSGDHATAIIFKKKHVARDRLDIKYLILKSRIISMSLGIKP